jgi:hypothetical protein
LPAASRQRDELIQRFHTIHRLPKPQRTPALEGIARGIESLAENIRIEAYVQTLNEVTLFSSEEQPSVLSALAPQVKHLPSQSRLSAFTQYLSTVRRLARYADVTGLMKSLVPQIGTLPQNQWQHAVQGMLAMDGLTGNQRTVLFDSLLDWAATLPREQQGDVLVALAAHLGELDAAARPGRFLLLADRIKELPVGSRGKPVGTLGAASRHLSEDMRRIGYWRVMRYLEIPHLDESPRPDELGLAALLLVEGIDSLPAESQHSEFGQLFGMIRRCPKPQRIPALIGIALKMESLPESHREMVYDAILLEVEQLSPEGRLAVLRTLIPQIEHLDPRDQCMAFTKALKALTSRGQNADIV